MEKAVSLSWSIDVDWESLDTGPTEERACFAAFGIRAHERCLTEGHDKIVNRLRTKPFLSAYHFAEWAAWNWWRLRWEPRSSANEWSQSHCMATIGGGYIWPDITFFSDGEQTTLDCRPTEDRPQTPFRYIADFSAAIAASQFEQVLDEFFWTIQERLESEGIQGSNFHEIFQSLHQERSTPELAHRRKIEALLGAEPDEADEDVVVGLLREAEEFSFEVVEEIAANRGSGGKIIFVKQLKEIAEHDGHDIRPRDMARLPAEEVLPLTGQVPAWKLGINAAAALRKAENLGEDVISDKLLAEMAGTSEATLAESNKDADFPFAIDENAERGRVVLRSRWHTGRRFELARLLGDRVVIATTNRLFPATRSYTYRQKMQRAFAAELLSPFQTVEAMLDNDYSPEKQGDVAEHFNVSEMTIRTLLVNNKRIEREGLDDGFMAATG